MCELCKEAHADVVQTDAQAILLQCRDTSIYMQTYTPHVLSPAYFPIPQTEFYLACNAKSKKENFSVFGSGITIKCIIITD